MNTNITKITCISWRGCVIFLLLEFVTYVLMDNFVPVFNKRWTNRKTHYMYMYFKDNLNSLLVLNKMKHWKSNENDFHNVSNKYNTLYNICNSKNNRLHK